MIGYKKEVTTLDSRTKTYIAKQKKNDKNYGSAFLLSFLLLMNIFPAISMNLKIPDFSFSSISTLRTYKKISNSLKSSQNYKIDMMTDEIMEKQYNLRYKNRDEKLVKISNIVDVLPVDQYQIYEKDVLKKNIQTEELEESNVIQIQNRLVHYGVYCGPGPADAFSGQTTDRIKIK